MVLSKRELSLQINGIKNINNKISRMIKNNLIFPLKKGLYETDINQNRYYLANMIYGPSYISFQTALGIYNMIPEKVFGYTSAAMSINKRKQFNNIFGDFYYYNIPSRCYPYYITTITDEGVTYDIATKEKALCDTLYIYPTVSNINEIRDLLLEDLRIDLDILNTLDIETIEECSKVYNCKNVTFLCKFLRRLRK